jgi:IclR family transcriptional regulator, pca regulon regulatory protein
MLCIRAISRQYVRSSRKTQVTNMPIEKQDFIEGTAKSLAILECFSTERQRLNATQAAERAGLTRAAARRHMLTLQELGYLEGEEGSFWLSPRVLKLAGIYLSSARLPRAVQPTLNRLAYDTGQAFSVAVLDADEVVIVARSGEHRTHSSVMPHGVHLGARLPAFATSTGRVLLGELSSTQGKSLLAKQKLAALTPNTVVTKKAVLAAIAKARRDGFSEVSEEHEFGVRALAVPLRDARGNAIAAINVVESSAKFHADTLTRRYLTLLLKASAEVRTLL